MGSKTSMDSVFSSPSTTPRDVIISAKRFVGIGQAVEALVDRRGEDQIVRAPVDVGLAPHRQIAVPPAALRATVERFNGFAASGRDEDFQRGASVYDRYYGDPRNRPNPCLAPLRKPPFYAVRIVPGDLQDLADDAGAVGSSHALHGAGDRVAGVVAEVLDLYQRGRASAARTPSDSLSGAGFDGRQDVEPAGGRRRRPARVTRRVGR